MDWNKATPVQMLAMGAISVECKKHRGAALGCGDCHFANVRYSFLDGYGCEDWAVEHPEEVIRACGVEGVTFEEEVYIQAGVGVDGEDVEQLRKQIQGLEDRNRMLMEDLDTERKVSSETLHECKAYKKALKWALKH